MAISIEEARKIVLSRLGEDTIIKSEIEYEGLYLFIAHWSDPLEGHLDPFFSVNPKTKEFRDFSPGDYSNPLKVINALQAAAINR